jgi:hypothetical protein
MHHVLYMIKCMSAIHFLGLYLGDFGYMLEAYLRGYGTWFEACHECFDTCSRNILAHIYGTWFEGISWMLWHMLEAYFWHMN